MQPPSSFLAVREPPARRRNIFSPKGRRKGDCATTQGVFIIYKPESDNCMILSRFKWQYSRSFRRRDYIETTATAAASSGAESDAARIIPSSRPPY